MNAGNEDSNRNIDSDDKHEVDYAQSNVVVESSAELGTQCLFYASEPMERGQVLELRFSTQKRKPSSLPVGEPFTAIEDRIALAREILVLSQKDPKALIDQVLAISKEINPSLDNASKDSETQPNDSEEELNLRITRRRIHWLATSVLSCLEETGVDEIAGVEDLKKLLLTQNDLRNESTYYNLTGKEGFILEELANEILCDVILKGSLGPWSDKSYWCTVSSELLKLCLRSASLHILTSWSGSGKIESQLFFVKEIESYVYHAVRRVVRPNRDLDELSFPCPEVQTACHPKARDFWENYEEFPKDVVVKSVLEEAYVDAMELCDEIAFQDDVSAALFGDTTSCSIAAKAPWRQLSTIMRSINDIRKGNAQVDERWYIENQVLSVAHAIASSGVLQLKTEAGPSNYSFARLARAALEADPNNDSLMPVEKPGVPCSGDRRFAVFRALPEVSVKRAVPSTLPLFLALVWPTLRSEYGWRMEVGTSPDDVTFCPPGHNGHHRRLNDPKVGQERIVQAQKRAKTARKVKSAGFGDISKLTKRMFVSAARDGLDHSKGKLVRDAVKQFASSILSELPGNGDEECRRRLGAIESAVCDCFDELMPAISSSDGFESEDSFDGGSPSNTVSYLMRVLLIMPSLLEQSGLPSQRIQDAIGAVRDLAQFLSSKNSEFFDESVRPCHEEYEAGHETSQPYLLPRMRTLSTSFQVEPGEPETPRPTSGGPEAAEVIYDLVLPEDAPTLTESTAMTMSQMIPCRATEYDIMKKARTISIGHPGIMCRHCLGAGGEGKYFFSSLDSMGTASTVVLSHLYRCKQVNEELKARLIELKNRHGADRKKLKFGAQAAYFNRLWHRLMSSGIQSSEIMVLPDSQHLTLEEDGTPEAGEALGDGPTTEFTNHAEVVAFIDETPPWSEMADIRECIQKYYDCVAYGGEIYLTNVMPKNFGSEWILAKLFPNRLSTKRSFSVG